MSDDVFNTPAEELNRLVAELAETKTALRELSAKLSRVETRLQRVFPHAFPKKTAVVHDRGKPRPGIEAPTLSPADAMALYEELVQLARSDRFNEVADKLSSLGVSDLSVLRQELGASLGKKKASVKTLTEVIVGRIRESVMLSKHTNRRQLVDESNQLRGLEKDPQND